jgi:hypothetical protein
MVRGWNALRARNQLILDYRRRTFSARDRSHVSRLTGRMAEFRPEPMR